MKFSSQPSMQGKDLAAFYDLAVSPTSFDFLTFLTLAEWHRRRCGAACLHVVIVPNGDAMFWDREPYDRAYKEARLHHLLAPMTGLLAGDKRLTICRDRGEAAAIEISAAFRFPEGYTVERPIEDVYQWANLVAERVCGSALPVWQAPEEARAFVRAWLAGRSAGRRVISITLREASYYAANNSNLAAWGDFARSVDETRFFPVLVRDIEAVAMPVPPELGGIAMFAEASGDVHARAALYEESFLNLSVAAGPMMLMWLKPACRHLIFKLPNLADVRSAPTSLRALGVEPGRQMVGATAFQRITWSPDTAEDIRREFAAMVERIETLGAAGEALLNEESPIAVARRLRQTGRFAAARRVYLELCRRDSGDPSPRYGLSLLELETPGRSRTQRVCRAARRLLGGMVRSAFRRWRTQEDGIEEAACFERWRFRRLALRRWHRVLALDGKQPDALLRLGELALQTGNVEAALCHLHRAAEFAPYCGRIFLSLGTALAAGGDRQSARRMLDRAVRLDPAHERAAADVLHGLPEIEAVLPQEVSG